MFSFGGKSISLKENHLKNLEQWTSANPTRSNKSQWGVKFRTRHATFMFFIDLPKDFPEKAPVFKFLDPVDHPWVDTHDGVTILNDGLLQWNPHCDITAIGKDCVHEFTVHPPQPRGQGVAYPELPKQQHSPKNYTVLANNRVSSQFNSKPLGMKLNPRNQTLKTGAVIFSMVTPKPELSCGMWMVTVGNRHVENMSFSQIIRLLGESTVPIHIVFQSDKPLTWLEPKAPLSAADFDRRTHKPQIQPQRHLPAKPKPIPHRQDVTAPNIPDSAFDILDTYSINKMKDIISDDLALEQLALDLTSKDLDRTRKRVRNEAQTNAEKNLTFKETGISMRNEVEKLRTEVSEMLDANDTLYKEMQKIAPTVDKTQVMKALQEAANSAEEESQELYSKFEEDEIAFVTFLKKYKAQREIHHKYLMSKALC